MAAKIHVAPHACERYRERIADLPDEAVKALCQKHAAAIERAAAFGAPHLKIGNNTTLVLRADPPDCVRVVTVIPSRERRPTRAGQTALRRTERNNRRKWYDQLD